MTTRELRRKYLDFFKTKGHDQYPSGSLVPFDVTGRLDESLLFNGAGMVQFKPFFRGVAEPPNRRLTTAQKCVRTGDIDEVGDSSHLTFFEMLGNFSFGDYFKKEAIAFSWEFLTSPEWLGLDPARLAFTVFSEDDEAFGYWSEHLGSVGIDPENRIFRLGEDTNYWPAGSFSSGPPGPCGPNSEMFYWVPQDEPAPAAPYTRADYLRDEKAGKWLEIWNDVFIQYDWQGRLRNPDRPAEGYIKEGMPDLPFQSIDTGMGLERTSAVLSGKRSVYDTDAFQAIIRAIESVSEGLRYGENEEKDRAIRIISDHIRTACFCIADGILPANNGRGYVLRRLIRRAVLKGQRALGFEQPFFHLIYEGVAATMGDHYTELVEKRDVIIETLRNEEAQFRRTLDDGVAEFVEQGALDFFFGKGKATLKTRTYDSEEVNFELSDVSADLLQVTDPVDQLLACFSGQDRFKDAYWQYYKSFFAFAAEVGLGPFIAAAIERAGEIGDATLVKSLVERLEKFSFCGVRAFELYDTYGIPLEVTQELCAEAGIEVDLAGYENAMKEAQERSRAADQRDSVYGGVEGGFLLILRQEAGATPTQFVGYDFIEAPATVVAAIPEVEEDGSTTGMVGLALDQTPFYAESGGQVSDEGLIEGPGFAFKVVDLIKQDGIYVHFCEPLRVSHPMEFKGLPVKDLQDVLNKQVFQQPVRARVDVGRRARITRHHTATHLLHAALRNTLGKHVTQAGSLVEPGHLRFDFTHGKAMSHDEITEVERIVNEQTLIGYPVLIHQNVPIQEAKAMGAMALFGEKYGNAVRVVDIRGFEGEPVSIELCGGCHVPTTAHIGFFKILHESSAASGVRRIEAVAGESANAWAIHQANTVREAAELLKSTPGELLRAIEKTLENLREERKKREKLLQQSAQGADDAVQTVGSVELAVRELDGIDPKEAQQVADRLVDGAPKRVAIVVVRGEGKVTFIAKLGSEAAQAGAHAGNLVKALATQTGGGGGGRADFATAGGRNVAALPEALAQLPKLLADQLSG